MTEFRPARLTTTNQQSMKDPWQSAFASFATLATPCLTRQNKVLVFEDGCLKCDSCHGQWGQLRITYSWFLYLVLCWE